MVANREYDYDFEHGHTVYGPATTREAVDEQMSRVEPNPGSCNFVTHDKVKDFHRRLIETGLKPYNPYRQRSSFRW